MTIEIPHTVAVEKDGEIQEYNGVAYAEEGTRTRDGAQGVQIVYANTGKPEPAKEEFIHDATIIGTYGDDVWPNEDDRIEWERSTEEDNE